MTALDATDSTRPYRGRRLSWSEFYALRPDLKADNDNERSDVVSLPLEEAPSVKRSH